SVVWASSSSRASIALASLVRFDTDNYVSIEHGLVTARLASIVAAMKPDAELLREIGENSTNVETAWAGAENNLARGLNAWTRSTIGRDREIAVRAAVACCQLVVDKYAADRSGLPPRNYIDDMLEMIKTWLDNPSREQTELVRSGLDV